MKIHNIQDASLEGMGDLHFELAIFALGYETRCTEIARVINHGNIDKKLVLAFGEFVDTESRSRNQALFEAIGGVHIEYGSASDGDFIIQVLRDYLRNLTSNRIRIFVDYSSMSKCWYSAIVSFLKFFDRFSKVEVYFCYQPGVHVGDAAPKVVNNISMLPGFEGRLTGRAKSVGIFVLGFEAMAVFAAHERLEPDEVYAVYAKPGAIEGYDRVALEKNREFLTAYKPTVLSMPLRSVGGAYQIFSDLVVGAIGRSSEIGAAALGPKPHCLALLLVAARFPELGVLQVGGAIREPIDVTPSGRPVVTCVEFLEREKV